MISVRSLKNISPETIYEVFLDAFSDYSEPVNSSYADFMYLLERRGYIPDLSFGAFAGDIMIGFTLNAVSPWNGKLTVYDTGTGIIKAFRNQGIARYVFNESLPVLRQKDITQYLLEVIKTNEPAVRLYKNAGFNTTRTFNYYIACKEDFKFRDVNLNPFEFKLISNVDWGLLCSFWDFEPSWQNSIAAIQRKRAYFTIVGIWENDTLAGYGIVEKHSGDIPQLAIARQYRRKGLATALVRYLVSQIESNRVSIINTPADYQPFNHFSGSINLYPGAGQYEMMLDLKV